MLVTESRRLNDGNVSRYAFSCCTGTCNAWQNHYSAVDDFAYGGIDVWTAENTLLANVWPCTSLNSKEYLLAGPVCRAAVVVYAAWPAPLYDRKEDHLYIL